MRSFVSVGGITLNCVLDGPAGGTPLVFLNSLGSDLRIWDDVIPHLPAQYRTIRYDKRGHGLSDSPPGPYTMRDHTQDLTGLLNYFGVEKAILVGMSVGGMIALDHTAQNHPGIQALILCDTAAKIGTANYWNQRIEAIRQNGLAPLVELILSRWFAADFPLKHPVAYRGYANLLARTDVNGYLATCAAIRDADLRHVLPGILCPALVLCGAEDAATPPEVVKGLADGLIHGRFQLIPEAGHTLPVEQPEAMVGAIIQFLEVNADV